MDCSDKNCLRSIKKKDMKNFLLKSGNSIKFPIVFITAMVISFGFFCTEFFHEEPIKTNDMAPTGMVYMQAEPSCCSLSVSQHMDSWKLVEQVIPRDVRNILVLLALGLVTLVAMWRPLLVSKSPDLDFIAHRLYLRSNPDLINLNQLRLAFARGILNPKVY